MQTFLEKTALHLINTYSDKISDLCIVLPNKRAGLFLKQHLSKLITQPIWLPEILGAEELIEKLSETQIIDNTTQLFELYAVYKESVKDPESFDEFSKWGQILLHDFNEIDRYLVPTDKLFRHINEARAIEVWNVGEQEITELQSQYLKFWEQLGSLYQLFHTHLKTNSIAYQGMAFRIVAEEIQKDNEQFIKQKINWEKIVFIGFNALTSAEETIITILKKQNKAEILWDADEYYLNNEIQESGLFLRKLLKKEVFKPFNWISNKFNTEQKEINILGIPQNIGQAKYLTNIIAKINSDNEYRDTAIVLADENMLIPVLQSIPNTIETINVTMGYPLKNTPLNNFFELFFTTLVNAERFGNNNQLTYHYNDLIKLFQLPFSEIVFGKENCTTIKQHIIRHNWVFINGEKLDFINSHLSIKFSSCYKINELITDCLAFINKGKTHYIKNKETLSNVNLELEYLFQYAKLFNQLTSLTKKYSFLTTIKSYYSLYRQILTSYSLELYGEPLKGLQVMGMLETRNIDFKNIILISTNEGILPAGKTFNSFIPFDIKRAYQLPTHIEKDAVYAYHFYRLIQNSSNIHILYNTETTDFGSGEQSRFVTQIENELGNHKNIKIRKQIIKYPSISTQKLNLSIKKTPEILEKIKAQLENGISPTAFNTYINCPLDYYYKYILGIKESEEVEETINNATLGTFIHEILENLYKKVINKNITEENLKLMLKLVPEYTKNSFSKNFTDKELNAGKNMLVFNVAKNYITTFIKKEIQFINQLNTPIYIRSLEEDLSHTFTLSINDQKHTIKLKGKADRIDSYGNLIRIIDYKTGLAEQKDLTISSFDDLLDADKKNKAFQVLMYAYMYSKSHSINTPLQLNSGIISFRKLSNWFTPFKIGKLSEIEEDTLNSFEDLLSKLIEEMIDINQPFTHHSHSKFCKLCS